MSRSLRPNLALALLGLAAFGAAPVYAQNEFQSESPRSTIVAPRTPAGSQSNGTSVLKVAPAATDLAADVPKTRPSSPLAIPGSNPVFIDPVESFPTTDPVIGPAQERTRRIPRITRYNPRLVPGVRDLRAATVQPIEEVTAPTYRAMSGRPVISGSTQAGPYNRARYLFYERDRRFNPTPYPGGGYGYNMVR
jgi:hypothetical protein